MDVGAGEVDDGTDGGGGLLDLPCADDVGGGPLARVVAAELALDGGDEAGELRAGAEAVGEGLVTDGEELDEVPVVPGLEGGDLLGNVLGVDGAAGGADVDTGDDTEAVGGGAGADVGEGVAVGRVQADDAEAGEGDGEQVGLNLVGGLAVAGIVVVGRVGDGPLTNGARSVRRAGGGGGGGRGDGAGHDGACHDGDFRRSSRGGGRGGWCNVGAAAGGGGLRGGGLEGAVDDGRGLHDGGDGGSGVDARRERRDHGDGDVLGSGHGRGRGVDGVSAGGRADLRAMLILALGRISCLLLKSDRRNWLFVPTHENHLHR